MDENRQDLPEEEKETEPQKHQWQQTKEGWYDHLNVTVKQLDIIIGLAVAALVVVAVIIALDASGVF